MECPRCHAIASPAALACAGCAAPLRLGEEATPARLDRPIDLDRRAPGRVRLGALAPPPDPLPAAGDEGAEVLEPDLAREPVTAPLGLRAAAALLDAALVALGTAPLIALAVGVLPDGLGLSRGLLPAALALGALVFVAYAALGRGLLGATCGDRLLRLEVIDRDGRTPGLGRAAARAALALLGTIALGASTWIALFTFSPRSLHDRVAGTFVVRAP